MQNQNSFNFETNEILRVEKIIRATFANQDRKKFAHAKLSDDEFPLRLKGLAPETLIQKIATTMPEALLNFNNLKLELHETKFLQTDDEKNRWLAEVKTLKWYGPFTYKQDLHYYHDIYSFRTATDSGNFQGLHLDIHLQQGCLPRIELFLYDRHGNPIPTYWGDDGFPREDEKRS